MKIYELPSDLFERAAPLFEPAWFDEAFIQAVFEGRQPGRIFVDDQERPTAALMTHTFEYYVAGNAESAAMRQFIRDAPTEVGVFEAMYGYCPLNAGWSKALLEIYVGSLDVIGRRGFKWFEAVNDVVANWRTLLPPGATMYTLNGRLATRVDRELNEHIGLMWGGYDKFEADGFGFCTMFGDNLASVCYTETVSASQANIGVVTSPPYRQRGLASATCAAFVEYCQQHALMPTWDCDTENQASAKLALKLGFQEFAPFQQLSTSPNHPTQYSQGLWSKTLHNTVTVWERSGM